MTDLFDVLSGKAPLPAGCDLRRAHVWPSVLITLVLVAATVWLGDAVFGTAHPMGSGTGGRALLVLIALPIVVLWWASNIVRALGMRRAGHFAWLVTDTEFLYVGPDGQIVGPIPLTDIALLCLGKSSGMSPVPELTLDGASGGPLGSETMALAAFDGSKIGLMAMRPTAGRTLFRIVGKRLQKARPDARIVDTSKY